MPTYRVRDTTGEDLGVIEHPAPNLEPGDVVVVAGGHEAIVTATIGAGRGSQFAGLLEVVIAPGPVDAADPA